MCNPGCVILQLAPLNDDNGGVQCEKLAALYARGYYFNTVDSILSSGNISTSGLNTNGSRTLEDTSQVLFVCGGHDEIVDNILDAD